MLRIFDNTAHLVIQILKPLKPKLATLIFFIILNKMHLRTSVVVLEVMALC